MLPRKISNTKLSYVFSKLCPASIHRKDLILTYRRWSAAIKMTILLVVIIFLSIWTIKKIYSHKEHRRQMSEIMDYINKEMDRILKLKTRDEQNFEFRKLKTHLPITPIRMTPSTAVFRYTGGKTPSILKRVISNAESGLNEDMMLKRLNGPHFMRARRSFRTQRENPSGKEETLIWIVCEVLDVKVSQRYIRGDEKMIREVATDILKGLRELHEMSIAHLDLKIGNVMGKTMKNGKVVYKLIDFGFAQEMPEGGFKKIEGKSYGTFPYKAPEIFRKSIHGLKSDIWGLGAICWYFSLQKIPFYFNNNEMDRKTYRKFVSEPTPEEPRNHKFFFARGTSESLRNFIKKCMTLDPEQRPTAASLLYHPFILGETMNSSFSGLTESAADSGFEDDSYES